MTPIVARELDFAEHELRRRDRQMAVDDTQRQAGAPRRGRPRARVLIPVAVAAAVAVAVALVGTAFLVRGGTGQITVDGLAADALLGKERLAGLTVRVTTRDVDGRKLRADIDGRPVELARDGAGFAIALPALADGEHQLRVAGDGAEVRRRFAVDTTPPALVLTMPSGGVRLRQPVTVAGTVEAGARLTAEGGRIVADSGVVGGGGDGGAFRIEYPQPPADATVVATDAAGNSTRQTVSVPVGYPAQVRAVHLTAYSWSYKPFRDGALKLVREKRINAVQLDIKEEDGIVGTDLPVPLARQIGAVQKRYDVAEAIRTLHAAGARVIGRVVAFRDPVLAKWAWGHGHRDWVVQSPGGGPYNSGYGDAEFTNFANPQVREYNLAVAEAAVKAGFDDIVFDYLRRPDGRLSSMRFPGLAGSAEQVLADYCAQARQRLHAAGGYLGAALFAQAVLRPQDTAQNVPAMARHLDLVVPMDYPNHWSDGSYGVADPAADTYPIVRRSLADWVKAVRGTGCVVVPWLWASDVLGPFPPRLAADEIRGARDNGLPGWFMWNAEAHYDTWAPAFSPDAEPVR
jgi:hypothetical protein